MKMNVFQRTAVYFCLCFRELVIDCQRIPDRFPRKLQPGDELPDLCKRGMMAMPGIFLPFLAFH